jgi:hypothetical protein
MRLETKNLLAVLFLALIPATPAVAAPGWWGTEWSYRAKVTVNAGASDQENAIIEKEVDFADWLKRSGAKDAFDPNSPRVTWVKDGQEQEVPSRFIMDADAPAKGTLLWLRPGTMMKGSEEAFFIYYDAGAGKKAKTCPELAKARPQLARNLLANSGFEDPNPGNPALPIRWIVKNSPNGKDVQVVKGEAHSGDCCLRIANTDSWFAAQNVPVQAGHRYALSGWMKFGESAAAGGMATITAWYSGKDGNPVIAPEGGDYSNYKTQVALDNKTGGKTAWQFFSATCANVCDPKTKENLTLPEDKLARGTELASIKLEPVFDNGVVYFDDVEFREMPAGNPMSVWIAAWEKRP